MRKKVWNKISNDEIKGTVNALGYTLLDIYIKNYSTYSKSHVVIQDDDGYRYDVGFSNLKRQISGNSKFETANPFTLENISLWLKLNNKNFELCEGNVYAGHYKDLFFYCFECEDSFHSSWNNVSHGYGCGICRGLQVGQKTSLEYLMPELSLEWNYEKNDLLPSEVTHKSGKKVWWICSECKHEWQAKIANRANCMGCPKCALKRSQSKIASDLKKYCVETYSAIPEYLEVINPDTNRYLPYDIYIPSGNLFIEVNGIQHYECVPHFFKTQEDFEYRQHLDQIKKEYAEKNGTYIEIDLRAIKTTEQAIAYVESQMG